MACACGVASPPATKGDDHGRATLQQAGLHETRRSWGAWCSPPGCRAARASARPAAGSRTSRSCSSRTCTGATRTRRSTPRPRARCRAAIAAVNALEQKPDFVVFTGDLTQTTDDPKVRRAAATRVSRHRGGAAACPKCTSSPASTTPSLDRGEAYQEVFGGPLHYTFDHKGVHFIVLDNTSDPAPILGDDAARVAEGRSRAAHARRSRSSCSRTARSSRSIRNGTGRRATAGRGRPADAVSRTSPCSTATSTTSTTSAPATSSITPRWR